MIRPYRALVGAALFLLASAPLSAAVYTIHLVNGGQFETRYEPFDAPWDGAKIVFFDEWGVLVALQKSDIAKIESDVEASGFGHQLDDTTIAVGWAPNDAPLPGTEEDANRGVDAIVGGQDELTDDEPIYEPGEGPSINLYPGLDNTDQATPIIINPPPSGGDDSGEPSL